MSGSASRRSWCFTCASARRAAARSSTFSSDMPPDPVITATSVASPKGPGADVPFGVNEVRLNGRQWLALTLGLGLAFQLMPWLWERIERFDIEPDFRIPYSLSKDYWLYNRRLRQETDAGSVVVLGDSVVWGEYVLPEGTLSHFLTQEAGGKSRFINAGVNGLFPLALEGLVNDYGQPVRHRKVL